MKVKEVEIAKEVIRSDGWWRFACGDVSNECSLKSNQLSMWHSVSGCYKKPDGEFWPEMNVETTGWIFSTGWIGRKKEIHSFSYHRPTIHAVFLYLSRSNWIWFHLKKKGRRACLMLRNKDVRGAYWCQGIGFGIGRGRVGG